jgi:hypothetical protein
MALAQIALTHLHIYVPYTQEGMLKVQARNIYMHSGESINCRDRVRPSYDKTQPSVETCNHSLLLDR